MSDRQVRTEEARRNFRELLNEVEHQGAHIAITRYDSPSAMLVPMEWYDRAVEALAARGSSRPGDSSAAQ